LSLEQPFSTLLPTPPEASWEDLPVKVESIWQNKRKKEWTNEQNAFSFRPKL
jgi:hypothetical protein